MSRAYYNEIDPYAAQWLRNLVAAGHIAPGDIDTRSIEDVHPTDLDGYTQCHFFAGVAVWSHALRSAGWPDDRPVWTGSCPCQPFSTAGKGAGFADERHLWPAFHWLIQQRRPHVIFGEQVASADGLAWLDVVCADLEAADYAVGAVDTCAAGFGAPHIRQRLYWVADSDCDGFQEGGEGCAAVGYRPSLGTDRGLSGMADPSRSRLAGRSEQHARPERPAAERGGCNGVWSDAEWLRCQDGKTRPAQPGSFPLADGAAARVGRLRAYGNAIVAPQAEEFVKAYLTPAPGAARP